MPEVISIEEQVVIRGSAPGYPISTPIEPAMHALDMLYGGPDTLTANVKRRVGTSDVAQKARVTLFDARSKRPVRAQWSDSVTGECVFSGIDATRRYIALAEYPTNPDDPSAEDYTRPVAGVSLKRGEGDS